MGLNDCHSDVPDNIDVQRKLWTIIIKANCSTSRVRGLRQKLKAVGSGMDGNVVQFAATAAAA